MATTEPTDGHNAPLDPPLDPPLDLPLDLHFVAFKKGVPRCAAADAVPEYGARNWSDGAFFGELPVLGIGSGPRRANAAASACTQRDDEQPLS